MDAIVIYDDGHSYYEWEALDILWQNGNLYAKECLSLIYDDGDEDSGNPWWIGDSSLTVIELPE